MRVAVEALVNGGKIVAYTAAYLQPQTALPLQAAPTIPVVSSARVRGGSGHRPAASGVDALVCRQRLSGAAILFAVTRAWNRTLKRPCDGNTVVGPKTMGLGMWVTRGQRASTRRGS
jgi:hypothetical protein